jgi:hypothetical protein
MSDESLLQYGDGELKDNYLNRWWRLQNLYKIRDKNKHLSNLRFNAIQTHIIKDVIPDLVAGRPIRHWDLKYRQGGVSTFWLLFWLDDTIFTPNTISGVLADKHDNLRKLMKIIRMGWETMPERLRPELADDSKERLSFAHNNSEMFAALSIRSTALHNLHISEWCFCADDEIRATLGAISPMTNVTGESTGNGIGNDGYETYQDAVKGLNGYKARFSPWFIQAEYRVELNGIDGARVMADLNADEKKLQALMLKKYRMTLQPEQVLWRRGMKRALKEMFPQEFPETDQDAFLASGTMFFDSAKIQALYKEARDWWEKTSPHARDGELDQWVQFYPPQKGHIYAAGADTQEGGPDYAVLKIIDVTARREAFVFRGRVGVKKFYRVCNEWGRAYNDALMGVERNNHGHAVLLGLEEDCRYPNMFEEGMMGPPTRMKINEVPKKKLGWNTSEQTRALMLDHMKMAAEGDPDDDVDNFEPTFTILDKDFLSEALTFKEIEGKFQAVPGKTDDDVIATSIANQMYQLVLRHRTVSPDDRFFASGRRQAD